MLPNKAAHRETSVTKTSSFDEQLYGKLHKQLETLQKKAGLSGGAEQRGKSVHTGMLMLDLVLGGGIAPGGMYTFVGPEGSCKSTATQTIMLYGAGMVPMVRQWDYEGSIYALS